VKRSRCEVAELSTQLCLKQGSKIEPISWPLITAYKAVVIDLWDGEGSVPSHADSSR